VTICKMLLWYICTYAVPIARRKEVLTTTGGIQTQQDDSDQQDKELPGKPVIKQVLATGILVAVCKPEILYIFHIW